MLRVGINTGDMSVIVQSYNCLLFSNDLQFCNSCCLQREVKLRLEWVGEVKLGLEWVG